MTDSKAIERNITKMVVLGGRFQLGDLYDYRIDSTLTDGRQCWESTDVTSATRVDDQFKSKCKLPDCESSSNKWENMGLDEHLKATVLAGLVNKYRGACNYLNDQPNPSQATRILIFRAKSKKEHLDLQTLVSEDVPLRLASGEEKTGKPGSVPTHVVVGVTYGAEAYCVLTQDFNVSDEADEDAREEAEEKLTKIARKMEDALNDKQDPNEFTGQFDKDEKKQLTRMKCRFYADLQSSAVRECNVSEAYKNCLKLIDQVQKAEEKGKTIPIAVLLCPLKIIIGKSGGVPFDYQDVDSDLIARCGRIWDELERVNAKLIAIRTSSKKTSRPSLRQFEDAVNKYKELVKKSLKNGVVKARETGDEEEIEKVAKILETHPLFKPAGLERWLRYKTAESEMAAKITGVSTITFFANLKMLVKELAESFDKKYALVLSVPPLDEKTNEIFANMKDYVDYTKLTSVERDDDDTDEDVDEEDNVDDDKTPWHMIQRKRNQVLAKIRELTDHVEKNKHLKDQVHFCITFGEAGKGIGCRYSVYEADNLLKGNLGRLPGPPTDPRIADIQETRKKNSRSTTVRLEWNYEDLGFPCSFIVEYQLNDSSDESWTQKKTAKPGENHLTLNLKNRSGMKFRVAADTCIGRSEFSEVIDAEESFADEDDATISDGKSECSGKEIPATRKHFQPMNQTKPVGAQSSFQPKTAAKKENKKSILQPPTEVEVELVTQSTAEIGWKSRSVGNQRSTYRILYWPSGQDASSADEIGIPANESGCRLEQLQPETTYFVHIVVVSDDGRETSEPSDEVSLTTLAKEIRFAETIVKRCKQIGNRNGMELYGVPLTQVTESRSTAERFAFGKADGRKGGAGQQNGRMQHRTILVMGATGSGKTTLINGMINYIFNVEWEDTFRFQLIQEQPAGRSQVDSQTSRITAYDIHHAEGFRVPYSLTIVDTPGYGDTKGLDRDQEITEMVRKFFEDKNGIQELDVIGFVAQASLPRLTPTQIYIFDSVLSIFGNDVKENINFLLTFADSQVPPVLSAIAEAGLPYPTDPDTGEPLHHKFNNSGFFCSSRESAGNTVDKFNRFFWRMGMENFQRFFSVLATMKTKSLSLTKQVLEERKQLEATVDGLQPLIKIGLSKMEEMRKTKQMITNSQAQIEANENVEFEVEVTMPQKIEIPRGQYLTNCNKCYVTCHNPCMIPNDDGKVDCASMDHSMPRETRRCVVCPEKCIWNMHANQPYKWEYVKQKQATSSDAIKQKYESELKRKLTAQDLIKVLQKDLDDNDREVLERVNTVTRCIQRLDEIALRPNPFSTPQYIDLIIDAEQQEKRLGFKERIESLKKLRQMAVITSKIKNKESLLSLDRKDDLDDQAEDNYDDEDNYSNAQTANVDDDDDNYDGASLTSASTYRHKFNSSFMRK